MVGTGRGGRACFVLLGADRSGAVLAKVVEGLVVGAERVTAGDLCARMY